MNLKENYLDYFISIFGGFAIILIGIFLLPDMIEVNNMGKIQQIIVTLSIVCAGIAIPYSIITNIYLKSKIEKLEKKEEKK